MSEAELPLSDLKAAAEGILDVYTANAGDKEKYITDQLRALMQVLPSEEGQRNLYKDIVNCRDRLQELRDGIVWSLIVPLKTREETPSVTPPEVRGHLGRLKAESQETESLAELARLKSECLRRDGWKCVITGVYDNASRDNDLIDDVDPDVQVDDCDAAHIIPFEFGEGGEVWDTLYRYSPEVKGILAPDTINDHRNVMTVGLVLRPRFSKFNISLEETDNPNVYTIETHPIMPTLSLRFLPKDRMVKMVNHRPEEYPLPDPVLLRVHAAIAQFLDTTGLGRRIETVMREREEILHLASDGSTDVARLLAFT